MTPRKFGIELEVVGISADAAAIALTDNGIAAYNAGYTHARTVRWKVVSDGSLSDNTGRGCCEVVSPVMPGGGQFETSLAVCRKVADTLRAADATVNTSCGLHVHIDAAGLTAADIASIVTRYAENEVTIDSWMPPSRRGNATTYCRSMVGYTLHSRSTVHAIIDEAARHAEYNGHTARYCKVNLHSYPRHGTIEFRHHSGTINADKIEHWVRFLQAFVAASIMAGPGPSGAADNRTVSDHIALNASEAQILSALQGTGTATAHRLCGDTGLSLNSMQACLSSLRRKGYDIVWDRVTNAYIYNGRTRTLTHVPTRDLNDSERMITGFLDEHGFASPLDLMNHTDLTLDSLRCAISACRRKGWDIRFSRVRNQYFIVGAATPRVRAVRGGGVHIPVTPVNGDVAEMPATPAQAPLWIHVPETTRTFYERRATTIAGAQEARERARRERAERNAQTTAARAELEAAHHDEYRARIEQRRAGRISLRRSAVIGPTGRQASTTTDPEPVGNQDGRFQHALEHARRELGSNDIGWHRYLQREQRLMEMRSMQSSPEWYNTLFMTGPVTLANTAHQYTQEPDDIALHTDPDASEE